MAALERLHKYLARAGVASRRQCEEIIQQGKVAVNGVVVRELGAKIDPAAAVVTVDGKKIIPPRALVHVMLNKPQGVITTAKEERGRPTVVDVVQNPSNVFPSGAKEQEKAAGIGGYRIFPVGRLDINTEGLLILTNDGTLTNLLTHPRYALEKEYLAQVRGKPTQISLGRLREGVDLDGKLTAPARVRLIGDQNGLSTLMITIHEGRRRQVRRMLEVVGHPVHNLRRTRVGPLQLGNLPVGKFRFLSQEEVESLRRAAGHETKPAERKQAKQDSPRRGRGMAEERIEQKLSAHTFKNRRRRT